MVHGSLGDEETDESQVLIELEVIHNMEGKST